MNDLYDLQTPTFKEISVYYVPHLAKLLKVKTPYVTFNLHL